MRPLILLALAAIALPAQADQAWVDDCPPDMMCAFSCEVDCDVPCTEEGAACDGQYGTPGGIADSGIGLESDQAPVQAIPFGALAAVALGIAAFVRTRFT